MKSYDMMTPAEKREADRMTRMGGENEARGLRPAQKKMDKRGSGKRMER